MAAVEGVPVNMQGKIVGMTEAGWVADMSRPIQLSGVVLPTDALVQTKSYGEGARVRITNHFLTGVPVKVGDSVAALVSTEHDRTGNFVPNSNHRYWNDEPTHVEEVVTLGSKATRWGLRP